MYHRELSADIKTCFVSPVEPKARANKTGNYLIIFILTFMEKIVCNTMLHMIFQHCYEPVLIQRM